MLLYIYCKYGSIGVDGLTVFFLMIESAGMYRCADNNVLCSTIYEVLAFGDCLQAAMLFLLPGSGCLSLLLSDGKCLQQCSKSIEWFIDDHRLLVHPIPKKIEKDRQLADGRWGRRGWARNWIIRAQESLALYKSFNYLWFWSSGEEG